MSTMQKSAQALGATIMTKILTANGGFLISVKSQNSEGRNLIQFVFSSIQLLKWRSQYYGVGPLCHIVAITAAPTYNTLSYVCFSYRVKLVDFPEHWKKMNADSHLLFAMAYEVS